jgi:hypothetical protein
MTFPLTKEQVKQAEELDNYLSKRIPGIERELKTEARKPKKKRKSRGGDVMIWHSLGTKLRDICNKYSINAAREREWLWESLQNLHASDYIKKKQRGKTRNHFEYCFELARFPIEFASLIKWSEWVYFFDSKTVHEDKRVTDWLYKKAEAERSLGRQHFRKFVQKLNRKIGPLDTSVLTDSELFSMCEAIWNEIDKEIILTPEISAENQNPRRS